MVNISFCYSFAVFIVCKSKKRVCKTIAFFFERGYNKDDKKNEYAFIVKWI